MKSLIIILTFLSQQAWSQDCSRILAREQFKVAARLKMPANFSMEKLTQSIYLRNSLSQMIRTNRLIKEVKKGKVGRQTKTILSAMNGIKKRSEVIGILKGINKKNGFCAYKKTRRGKRYFSYLRISQIILGMKKNVFNIKGKGPLIQRIR